MPWQRSSRGSRESTWEKKSRSSGGAKRADPRPQRRLHVVRHRQDLLLAQEAHVLRDRVVGAALPFGGARGRLERRQRAVPVLLERQVRDARASSRSISISSSCQV